MQRTIKVVSLVKLVLVVVALVAAYALGHSNGVASGWQSGADETAATYQVEMSKIASIR